jgi:hypothetical protein
MNGCKCWLCQKLNDLMVLRIKAQEAEKQAEANPPAFLRDIPQEQFGGGVIPAMPVAA